MTGVAGYYQRMKKLEERKSTRLKPYGAMSELTGRHRVATIKAKISTKRRSKLHPVTLPSNDHPAIKKLMESE